MNKNVVVSEEPKGGKEPENVISWWLVQDGNRVTLEAKSSLQYYSQTIVTISEEGEVDYILNSTKGVRRGRL
jgi:hypothetical protein